jgi:hypothetical protein
MKEYLSLIFEAPLRQVRVSTFLKPLSSVERLAKSKNLVRGKLGTAFTSEYLAKGDKALASAYSLMAAWRY